MTDATERGDYLARHGAALIGNGYNVLPIRPGEKAPGPKDWQDIQSTPPLLKKWLSNGYAASGVGILTKMNPAIDIDVLDEDITQQMIEFVRSHVGDAPVRIGKAPKALMLFCCNAPFTKITSSRFFDPHHPERDPKRKGQRIEILGDGQQFVAYAIHPDTHKPYTWTTDDDPLSLPSFDLPVLDADLARAVCDEFDRLAEEAGWERLGGGSSGDTSAAAQPGSAAYDPLAEIVPPDETEAEVARVKSALATLSGDVASAMDYDEWMRIMFALKWTRWACAEDLARDWSETSTNHGDEHFNRTWKGAQKRIRGKEITIGSLFQAAKDRGWDATRTPDEEEKAQQQAEAFEELDTEIQFLNPNDPKGRRKYLKKLGAAKLSAVDLEKILLQLKTLYKVSMTALRKELSQENLGDEKSTHAGYANMLLAMMREESKTDPIGVEGMLYTFSRTDGVWMGKLSNDYEVQVAKAFDGRERCERRSDYTAIASHAYAISAEGAEKFFEDAPVGLACEGRFYRVDAEGVIVKEPLRSAHRQRVLAPARPIVGEMPLFTKFLHSTFDGDGEQEQIDMLQEVIGAVLLGIMANFEKAVLFKGPGRAGKGTMMKIIEAMIPHDARSAVSPFNWDGEYYLANLAGKRLNIVGELPDDEPIPASYFKSVTGRDTLTGRHPSHRPFSFRNTAAHIFNTNHYVYTKDQSEAFYSRWLLMEFRNSRIGLEDGLDVNLAKRIIDEEMSAIMAWALQGAKRLQDRGRFEETAIHHKMMEQWRRRTSALMEFITDHEEVERGDPKTHFVKRTEFYMAYANWCKVSNRRPMGKQRLYDEVDQPVMLRMGIKFGIAHGNIDVIRGLQLVRMDGSVFEQYVGPDDDL